MRKIGMVGKLGAKKPKKAPVGDEGFPLKPRKAGFGDEGFPLKKKGAGFGDEGLPLKPKAKPKKAGY